MSPKSNTRPDYSELAQIWVNIAEYMDEGHSFDELYEHAISLTKSPALKKLWEEMRECAQDGHGSPLDIMSSHDEIVPKWFFQIFVSGMTSGIPTMWAYGGNAYLDAADMDDAKAFKKLYQAVVDCGMDKEEANPAVEQVLGILQP